MVYQIHELKHGKRAAKKDTRMISLSAVAKSVLPPIPCPFDVDKQFPKLTFPYGDSYYNAGPGSVGDCVEVMQYMYMLRAEAFAQGLILPITGDIVKAQYNSETDNQDTGLVIVDSLNEYRQTGKVFSSKKKFCMTVNVKNKIDGYTQINQKSPDEVKATVAFLFGMACGLQLPNTAQDQTSAGQPWEYVDKPGNEPGSWGGHGVYVLATDLVGPSNKLYLECFTWGQRQVMSYEFFTAYSDEDYGLVDARNVDTSIIDLDKFRGELKDIVGLLARRTIRF